MVNNFKSHIPKPNYVNNCLKRIDDLNIDIKYENFSKLEIKLDEILSKQIEYNSKIENLEKNLKINILNIIKDLFLIFLVYLSIMFLIYSKIIK